MEEIYKELCVEEAYEKLYSVLHGYIIADFITKEDMYDTLDYFIQWSKEAKLGDTFYFEDNSFTIGG